MADKWAVIRKRKPIKVIDITHELKEDKLRQIADALLHNRIFITNQFATVAISSEELWNSDPLNNRTWRYWIHTLVMVGYLVNAYEKFNDARYIEKALNIFLSWKQSNLTESRSDMAWHDHGTALRLIVICKLFEIWRIKFWDETIAEEFLETVEKHGEKLSDDKFYQHKHNHGLDQDIALYIAGVVFENMPQSICWKKLARERYKRQLQELFLHDGSYLEHTPLYSYIMCTRLAQFKQFLQVQADREYLLIDELISKQLDCLTYLVQPDGNIPPIGDGNPQRLALKRFGHILTDTREHIEYVVSKGKQGKAPREMDKVFPAGGYAVLRNLWKSNSATVQMIFYSAFNVRTHKHHDDLAVILYGHDQPLLTDAGRFNYVYSSLERQFVVSSFAHNSVVVDGRNTDIRHYNIGKSGLMSYYLGDVFSFVSGAHALYPGVLHQRMIVYLKPDEFIIMDYLKGNKIHTFEQVFNFYPTIECNLQGNRITGKTREGKSISLEPLINADSINRNTVNLVKGQQNPLRGWCCLQYGKLVPAWSSGYKLKGSSAQYATYTTLNPQRPSLHDFIWQQNEIFIFADKMELNISSVEGETRLIVDGKKVNLTQVNSLSKIIKGN